MTISTYGLRRITPRTIAWLKFSSAARRSKSLGAFLSPGHQAVAYAFLIRLGLVICADPRSLFLSRVEIAFYFFFATQIIRDHGIDVGKPEGWKLLDDLLCGAPLLKAVTTLSSVTRVPATRTTSSASNCKGGACVPISIDTTHSSYSIIKHLNRSLSQTELSKRWHDAVELETHFDRLGPQQFENP